MIFKLESSQHRRRRSKTLEGGGGPGVGGTPLLLRCTAILIHPCPPPPSHAACHTVQASSSTGLLPSSYPQTAPHTDPLPHRLRTRAVLTRKKKRVRNANRNEPLRGRSLLHGEGKTQNHRSIIEQWSVVGGSWRLVAVGGWRLVVSSGWRLAVGGHKGLSLTKKNNSSGQPWPIPHRTPPPRRHAPNASCPKTLPLLLGPSHAERLPLNAPSPTKPISTRHPRLQCSPPVQRQSQGQRRRSIPPHRPPWAPEKITWGLGGGACRPFSTPRVRHSVGLLLLYGALDGHPFFPSHVASGRCVLSATAAGAPAGVVSAFAVPRRWCVRAVLDVAGCALCASAAPSSWGVGGCAGCGGGRLTVFAVHTPPSSGHPQPASLCFCVCEPQAPCSWRGIQGGSPLPPWRGQGPALFVSMCFPHISNHCFLISRSETAVPLVGAIRQLPRAPRHTQNAGPDFHTPSHSAPLPRRRRTDRSTLKSLEARV